MCFQAGYDTAHSPHHLTIPGSFSGNATGNSSVFRLSSNVNVPGRWAFRTDHGRPGCTFNGKTRTRGGYLFNVMWICDQQISHWLRFYILQKADGYYMGNVVIYKDDFMRTLKYFCKWNCFRPWTLANHSSFLILLCHHSTVCSEIKGKNAPKS